MESLQHAATFISTKLPAGWTPKVVIVCGSGLGGLADLIKSQITLSYSDIPNFPNSTGHAGKLVFGKLGETNVACLVGRAHLYEGHSPEMIVRPVRIMRLLGCEILLVTNAAGSLNHENFPVGHVMVMHDHLNFPGLAGLSPLMGPNLNIGPRFPAMSDAYDVALRNLVKQAAIDTDLAQHLSEGIYCYVAGPSYETPAEARMLKMFGGSAVGMSTVPEVIAGRHAGLRVLGLSLITNLVALDSNQLKATHEEVLETSQRRAKDMQRLVQRIVELVSTVN